MITWGIPLNVTIGLIFYVILQKPNSRESVPLYSPHEILSFAVTGMYDQFLLCQISNYRHKYKIYDFYLLFLHSIYVSAHFILFYFVLIMSYRSIKFHGRRADFDWKIVGLLVAFIVLALSIGLTIYFIYMSVHFEAVIILGVTCLAFGEMHFILEIFIETFS